MKNYSLFLISFCMPTALVASRVFDLYKKAVVQYARDRSRDALERLDVAYSELMSSRFAGKAERLNAPYFFQQNSGSPKSLEQTLQEFREARTSAHEQQEIAELTKQLTTEKERLEVARRDTILREKERQALKAQLELVERARSAPEREAQHEELRTAIRSLIDTADIGATAPPAAIQQQMDRLFEVYAIAERFAELTQNPADGGLRKRIPVVLRNLFALYQGPDGTRGDAAIRARYRARIDALLNHEGMTTVKLPPTAEDMASLD